MNQHLVKPNSDVKLSEINANDFGDWEGKKDEAKLQLSTLTARLD